MSRSRIPGKVAAPAGAIDRKALSRLVSTALRHDPTLLGLSIDALGWAEVEPLLAAVRALGPEWAALAEADLTAMIADADKPRHEMADGRIRSLYGHSFSQPLALPSAEPPEQLYHGTSAAAAERILAEGLRPMGRQFVHLSANLAWARAVGYRKSAQPGLLAIEAKAAHAAGVTFHGASEHVWLASDIAPRFIRALPAR